MTEAQRDKLLKPTQEETQQTTLPQTERPAWFDKKKTSRVPKVNVKIEPPTTMEGKSQKKPKNMPISMSEEELEIMRKLLSKK